MWRQKVFWVLHLFSQHYSPLVLRQKLSLSSLYAFTYSLPLLTPRRVMYCSSIFTAADMNNGTIASVLLEGAPQQFAMIVLKLPGWENHLFCLML